MKNMEQEKCNTLDQGLLLLEEQTKKATSLSVQKILEVLAGKGRLIVLILLSLPFCQPIQIPGMSIPFGLIIAFIGLRMFLGKNVFLPRWLLSKTISSKAIEKIVSKFSQLLKKMKKLIRSRLVFLCHLKRMRVINGCAVFFLGIALAVPLPIPFTNLAAGWSILLISLGLLEDDGLILLFGYSSAFITFLFFCALFFQLKWFF